VKIFRSTDTPLEIADAATFVGRAHRKTLASHAAGVPVVVYRVEFDPGARTNWHTHSGAQWLFVIEGCVRVQMSGEAAQDVDAGGAIVIAPGEKHWHGAAPGMRAVHLAMNLNATTEWLEPVTDEEYRS
jgi:quercetin dioxygenase-like cupin family protein